MSNLICAPTDLGNFLIFEIGERALKRITKVEKEAFRVSELEEKVGDIVENLSHTINVVLVCRREVAKPVTYQP